MKFEHKKDEMLFSHLKETIKDIIIDMAHWSYENGCPFNIIRTVTTRDEDFLAGRKSISHMDFRAVDISTNGWDSLQIKDFLNYYNKRFGKYGETNKFDGQKRLITYGDSKHLDHFHVAIGKGFE